MRTKKIMEIIGIMKTEITMKAMDTTTNEIIIIEPITISEKIALTIMMDQTTSIIKDSSNMITKLISY